mgnify:CR=1 FL=1
MLFAWNRGTAYLFVAMIGFFNLVFLNAGNSIFQVHTPDEYRGRVMSVYTFLSQGSLPLGNFFAGSVMQSAGASRATRAAASRRLCCSPYSCAKRKKS